MITEINFDRLFRYAETLSKKERQNLLFVRLYSNAKCFSQKGLCKVYLCENNDKICGVLCIYSGCATAFFKNMPDPYEFSDFLRFNSVDFLEINKKMGTKLNKIMDKKMGFGSFFYLKKCKKCDFFANEISLCEDVRAFFEVLKLSSSAYEGTSFESYYCDYFYRKNLPASLYCLKKGEKIISTLAILHINDKIAIISDVATLPEYRNRGYASSLIKNVCASLIKDGLTPALLCTDKDAKRLYKELKFKEKGKFCILMIKD